jgi:hypothetical protein
MSKLLLIEGVVTEVKSGDLTANHERITQLEALLRESLNKTGDRAWHEKVYGALGESMPPVRKLKGKIPRYQQGGNSGDGRQ